MDACGRLEVTLDAVVARGHPVTHPAEQEQAHRERQHHEGTEAPDDFFHFGEDRVEIALGTLSFTALFGGDERGVQQGHLDRRTGGRYDGCQHVISFASLTVDGTLAIRRT